MMLKIVLPRTGFFERTDLSSSYYGLHEIILAEAGK